MSILIKGMEMPTNGELLCINIYPDGKVCIDLDLECKQIATAVELPPHGRLIDADMFNMIAYQGIPDGRENTFDDGVEWLANKMDIALTIIEAEDKE